MCYTPFNVKDCNGNIVPVPCGKCELCVKRKVSQWSFRLMNEDRYSTSAHFITLTYDSKHCPVTNNGFMGLDRNALPSYFKRLRTDTYRYYEIAKKQSRYVSGRLQPLSIKYYGVGEYGSKSGRPHYHAIIFNAEINKLANAWRCCSPQCGCGKLMGDIHYGTVSGASVGYTLKYMSKKWHPKHSNDDRYPQRAWMSKHLGAKYLTPQVVQWHKLDLENNMHLTLKDGRKISMPRYYKDKIYSKEERGYLKGYFEQKLMDLDYEQWQKNTGKHSPGYYSGIAASYRRMYYKTKLVESI